MHQYLKSRRVSEALNGRRVEWLGHWTLPLDFFNGFPKANEVIGFQLAKGMESYK